MKKFLLIALSLIIIDSIDAAISSGQKKRFFAQIKEGKLDLIKKRVEDDSEYLTATDRRGRTGLMIATGSGHENIVDFLISKGADLETEDTYKATALSIAVMNNQLDFAQKLVEAGANLSHTGDMGMTPLEIAESLVSTDNSFQPMVDYLKTAKPGKPAKPSTEPQPSTQDLTQVTGALNTFAQALDALKASTTP